MDLFLSQDDELVPASAERITFQLNESGVLSIMGYIQMSNNAYFSKTFFLSQNLEDLDFAMLTH